LILILIVSIARLKKETLSARITRIGPGIAELQHRDVQNHGVAVAENPKARRINLVFKNSFQRCYLQIKKSLSIYKPK